MLNFEIQNKIIKNKMNKLGYPKYEFFEVLSSWIIFKIWLKNNKNKQIKLLEFEEYIFKLFTFLDKIFWTELYWEIEVKNEKTIIDLNQYILESYKHIDLEIHINKNKETYFKIHYQKMDNIKQVSREINDATTKLKLVDELFLR